MVEFVATAESLGLMLTDFVKASLWPTRAPKALPAIGNIDIRGHETLMDRPTDKVCVMRADVKKPR